MSDDDDNKSEIKDNIDEELEEEDSADAALQVAEAEAEADPIWCLVANVAKEIEFGEEKQIKSGIKHFPAGAKVYCFPPLWGDGYERIKVIGRHRGSHRYATMVVQSKHLTNWRAKLVYSPFISKQLKGRWDGSEKSRELATKLADSINSGGSVKQESAPASFFDLIITWVRAFMKKVNR